MAIVEEPITSRLDRLDHMLRHLEEIRGCNRSSPKRRSCASIASSGTDGHASSVNLSPKSIEKHSRPIEHVLIETEVKGTLIERLELIEDRVLKLCLQLELLESERKIEEKNEKKAHKLKGLKQLVKQCVKGEGKY